MAKYFLGSVGKAEAFRIGANGKRQLAFVSKTLTDSGLNISTTKDDIRAGEGAPIQFSFYHDPSVEITLTDVLWKKEYLTAQLGAEFKNGSQDYVTKEISINKGVGTYETEKINKAPLPCGDEYLVWCAPKGSDDWAICKCEDTSGNPPYTITVLREDGLTKNAGANGDYCIRFLGDVNTANVAEITSLIIPEELFLIITAPIFAGDACVASKGKAAGHITFEVPRFLLNGAQEFSMNMSQNQTMSLAGVALASTAADCTTTGGKLLRIIEFIDDAKWQDSVVGIIVDGEYDEVDTHPVMYAEMKDGSIRFLEDADLVYKHSTTLSGLSTAVYGPFGAAVKYENNTCYLFKVADTTVESEIVKIGTVPAE